MKIGYDQSGRAEMLKERSRRCVCKYCGQSLSLKRISFSEIEADRVEIFCLACHRIEFGVEPEIYQSALYFVEEMGFNYYPDIGRNEKTKRMNVAKVCEIMAWENKNLGILTRDGFQVPLAVNSKVIGECVVLTNEDIGEIEAVTIDML